MLPVRKTSKMRKRARRSHQAISAVHLISCPQCGTAKLPHCACGNCGYVNQHTRLKQEDEE